MNQPYVKRINYKIPYRSSRRGTKTSTQVFNGRKNGMVVHGNIKYKKVMQTVFDPITLKTKRILHYLAK